MTVIVTSEHLRSVPGLSARAGYCIPKTREFFRRHGLDFRAFLIEGIPAEVLEATGDALAIRLAEHARAQEAKNGRE